MIRMSARIQILRKAWVAMQKNPLSRSGGPCRHLKLPQYHQACGQQDLPSTMREMRQTLLQLQLELRHPCSSHDMVPLSSLPPLMLSPATAQGELYASAASEPPFQQSHLSGESEGERHGLSAGSQHAGPPQLPEMPSFPPMFPDGAFE
jgi:hypothetical protein